MGVGVRWVKLCLGISILSLLSPCFLVVFQCPHPPLQFLVRSCYGTVTESTKGYAGIFE